MTLLRNINFSDIFSDIRDNMNIDNKLIVDKNFGKFSFNTDWENIEISGITITPLDKNFSIKNNELFYKNTKVLLYIRDQAMYGQPEDALKNYKSAYKFHLSWCQTLQTMFNSGKYEKYVVSTRQDDVLLVRAIGSNNKVYESEQKLHVCRYCLSTLNYKGYRYATKAQKDKIYNEFSLKEFLMYKTVIILSTICPNMMNIVQKLIFILIIGSILLNYTGNYVIIDANVVVKIVHMIINYYMSIT